MKYLCAQSCVTLWDPVNCSLPGFSVHGIFQARIQKWVAISYFKGSSQPRDCVSSTGKWVLYHCATWEYFGINLTKYDLYEENYKNVNKISNHNKKKNPCSTLHLGVPSWGDTADSLKHDDQRIISKCDIWKLFQ